MQKLFFVIVLCTSQFLASAQPKNDWAQYGKYQEANKTAPKGGVVFLGNSITEGWAGTHPKFFASNNYIGRGIGGQVTSQMLARFRSDVINLAPKAVVILAGTNDIAQNNGPIPLAEVMNNIISMSELAKTNKIKVVLCSVLPASEYGWRKELKPANDIIQLNSMIQQYALKNKIPYVDYHKVLKDERNGLPGHYAQDGVHPTPEAFTIMEQLVKPVIDRLIHSKKRK